MTQNTNDHWGPHPVVVSTADTAAGERPCPDTSIPQAEIPRSQLPCPRCGAVDTLAISPGSGPHYASARCRHCGAFLRWLSQYTPAERHARRQQARHQAMAKRPPSPAQLAYLTTLGDSGPPPATMAEASQRIATLKRGRVA